MTGRAVVVLALAAALATVHAPAAGAQKAHSAIVGGTPISITAAPWQVYLGVGSDLACGGSVLDATHVLTAAHCVIPEGSTTPRAPSSLTVRAGFDDVSEPAPAGSQVVGVASLRTHPLYDERTKADDVAVLTLAKALSLAGARTKPIALAPVGGGPAPGAALGFSGYGAQAEGQLPDGALYGTALTAISDVDCRAAANPNSTATIQCVAPGGSSPCFADSGGPLTAGGVQVGVASYAPPAGCGRGPSGFTDVTAPEIRAFIDGAAVPVAPRITDQTVLFATQPPVRASPMTCAPGTWTGAPGFAYTFWNEAAGQALQAGPSATFVPRAAQQGATIACIVQASNAGGTTTSWSGVAAAVQADRVRPNAVLRSARCRGRRCRVRLAAADPNSLGVLRVLVTAERRVRGRCGERRRRCTKTRASAFKVTKGTGTAYRARSARLARGRVTIRVRVVDAAGNRRKPDITRRVRVR
jgi:hypothetical protein